MRTFVQKSTNPVKSESRPFFPGKQNRVRNVTSIYDPAEDSYSEAERGFDFGSIPLFSGNENRVMPKLTIGRPGDRYEQEADSMADRIMSMPEPIVQRKCAECKEEDKVQRVEDEDEEETVQSKEIRRQAESGDEDEDMIKEKSRTGQTPEITPSVQNNINSMKGGGQPLPLSTRAFFEPRFNRDFSNVRLHTDNRAAETAKSINARAFTVGRNIAFGEGQYTPGTSSGKRLLAHELTHTVQQKYRLAKKSDKEKNERFIIVEVKKDENLTQLMRRIYWKNNARARFMHTIERERMIKEIKESNGLEGNELKEGWLIKLPQYYFGPRQKEKQKEKKPTGWDKFMLIWNSPWAEVPGQFFWNWCEKFDESEAHVVWRFMKNKFVPLIGKKYGSETRKIFDQYLGSGGEYEIKKYGEIENSFRESEVIKNKEKQLRDSIRKYSMKSRKSFIKKPRTVIDLSTIVPKDMLCAKKDEETWNFKDTDIPPGLIAGGVGMGPQGADERCVSGDVQFTPIVNKSGETNAVQVLANFNFRIKDSLDFCLDGGKGGWWWSGFKARLIIKALSRLEKTGRAIPVPFELNFQGEPFDEKINY